MEVTDLAELSPPRVHGDPRQAVVALPARLEGVGDGAVREELVAGVEDLFGGGGGGDDHCGDPAELQPDDGAVRGGELGQGLVGFVAEFEEVSDDRKRLRTRWKRKIIATISLQSS